MAEEIDQGEGIGELPFDLVVVMAVITLVNLIVFVEIPLPSSVRAALSLLFLLVLPGYAFVAALFPEAHVGDTGTPNPDDSTRWFVSHTGKGIDGLERATLSFATGIVIAPVIGILIEFTPWEIKLGPIVVAVSAFTFGMAIVAAVRRRRVPRDRRFIVPIQQWVRLGRRALQFETRKDLALNVFLVMSLLAATGSVAYTVAGPQGGDSFTEFYLLTENESEKLVATDYPRNFTVGESRPLYVGITNHEGRQTNYTVLVVQQRVSRQNNTTRVRESRLLDRFRVSVGAGETRVWNHSVTPTMTGDHLRLTYLLYKESPPADPTVVNAYRDLHLWINVSDSATANATNRDDHTRGARFELRDSGVDIAADV